MAVTASSSWTTSRIFSRSSAAAAAAAVAGTDLDFRLEGRIRRTGRKRRRDSLGGNNPKSAGFGNTDRNASSFGIG